MRKRAEKDPESVVKVIITKRGSTHVLNFKTPGLVQEYGYISLIVEHLNTLHRSTKTDSLYNDQGGVY